MVAIVSYDKAMAALSGSKRRHLLLGNGFSIALKPDIFSYGSLYENADFAAVPHVKRLFEALGTQDFEIVIKHLQDAAKVVEVYRPSAVTLARSLRRDAAAIKDALVTAIAKRHPDRPFDIRPVQYASCRKFVSAFDHIFTLNYDVLLYWALMQDEVDKLTLRHDDGFRHPEDDPDKPWVSWQQANSATVSYLHGALHLFDAGAEITGTLGRRPTSLSLSRSVRRSRRRNIHSSLQRARAARSGSASSTMATCTRLCAASSHAAARQQPPLLFLATRSPPTTGTCRACPRLALRRRPNLLSPPPALRYRHRRFYSTDPAVAIRDRHAGGPIPIANSNRCTRSPARWYSWT